MKTKTKKEKKRQSTIEVHTKPSVFERTATQYEIKIDQKKKRKDESNKKKQISVCGARVRARALCGISMIRMSEIRAESGKNSFSDFDSFCGVFRRSYSLAI